MLKLPDSIIGRIFTHNNTDYICLGFGIGDAGTSAFVVAAFNDPVTDTTSLKTVLLKDAVFKGDITVLK